MKSRTFIIYLEPSGDSLLSRQVNTARSTLGALIGYDESHLYPLHCSLTSFFDVHLPEPDCADENDALDAAIRDALTTHLSAGFEGAVLLAGPKQAPTWSSSLCSTRSCSLRSRSSSVSAFADDTPYQATEDDDEYSFSSLSCEEQNVSLPSENIGGNPWPLPECVHPPGFSTLRRPEIPVCPPPRSQTCFRVKRQLSKEAAMDRDSTHLLEHVHVTPDASLIYPITTEGFSQESIASMCRAIYENIKKVIPNAEIRGSRRAAEGIQPKHASHITLLNNKGVPEYDLPLPVNLIARALDQAASLDMAADVVEWDIVVNELLAWGSLEGPRGSSGRRFEVVHPHDFVEICRLRGVGISAK